MIVENVRATMVRVAAIYTEEGTQPVGRGEVVGFSVAEESVAEVRAFAKWLGEWKEKPVALSMRRWYMKKTLDQLALFWSLVGIMVLEQEGRNNEESKMAYYHGLLEAYAPRIKTRLPSGKEGESVKTLSEMNTVEAAQMIEGAFAELVTMTGISFEASSQIKNYMIEWRQWRGKRRLEQKLSDTYGSLDEYKRRVPYCEATLTPLGTGEGHLAHIVSRGSGGENLETWNFLHLCPEVHLMTQHAHGWVEMLKQYPHLMGRVNTARAMCGKKPLNKPEDGYAVFT